MAGTVQQHAQKIMSLMQSGHFNAAAKAAKGAMKAFPREANFANLAGSALAQGGDPRAALTMFTKALKLRPGDADIQNNLIQALLQTGQNAKAQELIDKLLPKRANPAHLWFFKGVSLSQSGDARGAIEALDKAIEIDPKNPLAHNLRGISHVGENDEVRAIADFRRAHDLNPRDPDPLANIGMPLARIGDAAAALDAVEQALALDPNHINALHRKAILLAEAGRISEAIATYQHLLGVDPLHAEAYAELVATQSAGDNVALLPDILAAQKKLPSKSPLQADLNRAAGNIYFQQGDYAKAGAALARFNDTNAKARPYDSAAEAAECDRVLAAFPLDTPLPSGGDDAEPTPIFVLGQPRSGTTLSEMILTAHPAVQSCGELDMTRRLVDELEQSDAPFDPAAFAAGFRAAMPVVASDARAFVDKMPLNYRYIGYLLAAFPKAPVIHIARDPRDVALSMWRSYFPSGGMSFTFDQRAMAKSANTYRRYMTHWEALAPDRILTLDYGEIVSDLEGSARRMADFCGLDWHEDMARPEKNTAAVRTASVVQVRQGVHKKSLGGWHRMEDALTLFLDTLDPALWPDLK